ncbi:succinate dehydrogenase [Burkholderia ubonensis]|uniref:succinate dehydrogenase, cytochrome b556 subunit n=1 Tax=Burkholderia ubonensis TaxID=101571 RepID=UPI000755909D|nr:succinate dehydrogenase, cytochrome b556 subunit [Burkholderia ubonensis]KVM07623.1 succinate dehydrogenase [Burkholderia ubonensis]KVM11401.1 succinate dehydrogenase [Burkholderia ubonensis]KVM41721.1 succinate dehydrogenase [Burkholderia ubonensis]KVX50919.1 succinate dehydrogenase [Burkholderia ubonensis]
MTRTSALKKSRKKFSNIGLWKILFAYHLPLSGYVSIFHRVSGALLFLLLPFVLLLFDQSITSKLSFEVFKGFLSNIGIKLIVLGAGWAFLFHFCAGLRHLLMDSNHNFASKKIGTKTSAAVTIISTILTVVFAAKLFGAF